MKYVSTVHVRLPIAMQFRNQSTADSSNATNSCRVVSENSTRPLHFSIPLTAAAVSTCVWICGALYLVLLRRHRAMRASGVELSACVLAAAALRLASLVLIAFSQRTRLWCAGLSSLAMLATTLTLTAIALKVSGLLPIFSTYVLSWDLISAHYTANTALWLYEFKFQMVSGYSTLVQFQRGTRKVVIFTITANTVDIAKYCTMIILIILINWILTYYYK